MLDDPALAGQYAIVVDRRSAMPNLEVHCEAVSNEVDSADLERRLLARLEQQLRLRVIVRLASPGAIPRQEAGKARRVLDRTSAG